MAADLIFRNGVILTMDRSRPSAEACAVKHGRILAVGSNDEIAPWMGPETKAVDLAGRCLLPGFVEPHAHPTSEASMWGSGIIDIRPAIVPDGPQVIDVIRESVANAGSDGVFFDGWDPLLQHGLPAPTLEFLDGLAPETPLVIVHNSGHRAYFNSKLMEMTGISHDTPDPYGASYGRDHDGQLTGVAHRAAAVLSVMAPALRHRGDVHAALRSEFATLSRAGVTTVADMSFAPELRPVLDEMAIAGDLDVRLRLYESSNQSQHTSVDVTNGNNMVKQIGVKLWIDGSPWTGTAATSFPYLDTPSSETLGLPDHHHSTPSFTSGELYEQSEPYFVDGWQLACHAQGDTAIDVVLDAWEELLERHPRPNHRLRIEHCGAMASQQYERAASLGITCSLFIAHIHHWGDVLADDLFGPDHSARWCAAASALRAGVRISFHNDIPVAPEAPLVDIATAITRTSRSGRVMGPDECINIDDALRARTIDAAWQMFADDITGSIEPGKYADFVVLEQDPHSVAPASVATIDVAATFLEGRQVYGNPLA
jgi:predicted amidohydrolase YtcJ